MIGIGSIVSGYRIEGLLGAGGMGTVYLAQNPELPRHDALKVLSAELSRDADFRARFVREADVAASLQHPNIVSIYSRGETDEHQLWIAMQFVDGPDADAALRAGTMNPMRAVHIIGEVAQAIDYANDHHVVHRDIKPGNFLLTGSGQQERVLLGDFGIARGLDDYGLTLTGSVISTIAYAAPEVLAGQGFDRRADLYSLGCSLFRLLTGNTPFAAASANGPAAVMMAHLHTPPPRVSDYVPDLPPPLDHVIATAMAKNPHERFHTASHLAAAAAAALHQHCPPGIRSRALPAGNVDATPRLADSNWWRPPSGTRTGHGMPALPTQIRSATDPRSAAPPPPAPRRRPRWLVPALSTTALILAAAITTTMATGEKKPVAAPPPPASTTTTTSPEPPPPAVQPSALRGLLLPVAQIQALMGGMTPKTTEIDTPWDLSDDLVEKECVAPYEAGQRSVYAKFMFAGYQLQILVDQDQTLNTATQTVIGLPNAAQAQAVVNEQVRQWDRCANRTVTFHKGDLSQGVTFNAPTVAADGAHLINVHYQYGEQAHCEHVLTSRENVVVDVTVCSIKPGNQAVAILDQIVDRIGHA